MGTDTKHIFTKISRNTSLVIIAVLCIIPVLAQPAFAVSSYGTSAPMTGLRCFTDDPAACAVGDIGLETTTGSGWEDATLEWDITCNGICTYKYTLTNFDMGDVSHFTIDISNDLDCDDIMEPKHSENGDALASTTLIECKSQDGLDQSLKFDIGGLSPVVYEFKVNRMPVFFDVFIKNGQFDGNNIGFPAHTSMDDVDYVAAPNSDETPPGGNGFAVGGEFIGIDTTAVLAAGAQNTAAWMIPVIVAAAGLGIVIARKF